MARTSVPFFWLFLTILASFLGMVLSGYHVKTRFDRSVDDREASDVDLRIHGRKGIRTFTDYDTRFIAYKDVNLNACYLERIRDDLFERRNVWKWSLPQQRTLYVSDESLTKLEAWRLAGGRIVEFCQGLSMTMLRRTRPVPGSIEDPFFNEIPEDENDIVQRRVSDVLLTPLLARAKRQILLENREMTSNSQVRNRPRRQVTRRGRFHGQTQSQYLDFSPEGEQGGKAEAEATHESSHAVVSGNRGMGQAQSMSGNGDACEGCPGYAGSNRIEQGRLINGGGERYVEGTGGVGGTSGLPSGPGSFPSGIQSVSGSYPANLVHPGDGSVSYSRGVRPGGGDNVLYPMRVRSGPYPGIVQPINGHYIEGDRVPGGTVYPGDVRPTGEPGTISPGPYPGTPGGSTIYPGNAEPSGVSRTAGPGSYPGGVPNIVSPRTYPGIPESGGVSGITGPGTYNVPGVTGSVAYPGGVQPTGNHGLYSGGTVQPGRHFGTEQGSDVVTDDVGSRGPVVYTGAGASGTGMYAGDRIVGNGMAGGIRNGIGGTKETEGGMRGTYPSTAVDTAVYPGSRQTGGMVPVGTNGRPLGSGPDVGVYPSGTGTREPAGVYHDGGRTILPGMGSDGMVYPGGPGTYPGVPVGSPRAGMQSRQGVLSPGGVYQAQPISGPYGGETRQHGGLFDGAGGEREVRPIGTYPAGVYPSGTGGPVLYPGGTTGVSGRTSEQQSPGARTHDGGYVSVGATGLGGAEVYYPGAPRGGGPVGHPAGGQLAYPATGDGRMSGQYSLVGRDDGRQQFSSGGDVSTARYNQGGVTVQRGQGSTGGTEQYPTGVIVGQYPSVGNGHYPAGSTVGTGGQGIMTGGIPEGVGVGVGGVRGGGAGSGQYNGRIIGGGAYPGGGTGVGGPIAAPLYLQPKSEGDRGYNEQSASRDGIVDDGSESQALSSVKQVNSGTQANASAQGKYGQGTAQSQVTGTYSGSGSFSAQAGTSDVNKSAQTQINGDKKGATSSSQGTGGYGTSQSKVQLNSDTGATSTGAQSSGWNHGTSSQVQASSKGGMADAQANGEGSTSSQAQIGFQPYLKRNEKLEKQLKPFRGGGTASAQSGTYKGQSQSQLHGEFQYGITYSGAAQAGSGSGAAASRKPFNFTNTDTELFKTFEPFEPLEPDVTTTTGPIDIETEATISPPLENDYDDDGHTDGDQPTGLQTSSSRKTVIASPAVSKTIEREDADQPSSSPPPSSSHITHTSTQPRVNDDQVYDTTGNDEYEDEYEDEDYDSSPSTLSRQTGPEGSAVSHDKDVAVSIDDERSGQLSQTTQLLDVGGRNYGIRRTQDSSVGLNEGDMLQPGQSLPGYTIPPGFRGRVTSVSGDGTTNEADGQSELQTDDLVSVSQNGTRENKVAGKTIVSEARSLRGKYDRGSKYKKARTGDKRYSAVKPTRLRSMLSGNTRSVNSDQFVKPNYYTVTNSIAGKMDDSKNAPRKYEHRYYTKSSTCGYFTFSCNIVYGSNGRTKICKPKLPTNPDGTPMRC